MRTNTAATILIVRGPIISRILRSYRDGVNGTTKQSNGCGDRVARIHSSSAAPMMTPNTQPPLRSNPDASGLCGERTKRPAPEACQTPHADHNAKRVSEKVK